MPQTEVAAHTPDSLERREFWSAVSAASARFRDTAEEWADYAQERDEWVGARLADEHG